MLKWWSDLQYLHLGLLSMDIKGLNMIKMFVSSLSAIHSYYVYQTLVDVDIM